MLRSLRSPRLRRALAVCCLPILALAAAPFVAPFAWPGTYHLVGTGFPDGAREAVLKFTQHDTLYDVTALAGPPGAALLVRVVGDSAHILWDLEGATMVVDLRGTGDSVTGRWFIEDRSGPIVGKRR